MTTFPPNHKTPTTARRLVITEIAERRNPPRRPRHYPRVIKQRYGGNKNLKRPWHGQTIRQPTITILYKTA